MRFVFNKDVYGWRMTGIIGAGGRWFLGYSTQPAQPVRNGDLCDCTGRVNEAGLCGGVCDSFGPVDQACRTPVSHVGNKGTVVRGPWAGTTIKTSNPVGGTRS
jgi:hypothetical protein